MANKNPSPIGIEIVDIQLFKMNGTFMSLMPQFIELSLYQSVFQAMHKAELVIFDSIGFILFFPAYR